MNKLTVVMYHYVRDISNSRYPGIKGLDVSMFREQIEFLKQNFIIVSMEQVLDAYYRNVELPKDAVLLTFDDGYIDNYTYIFPILKEHKVQGSFFIPGKTFKDHRLLDVNKIHYILAGSDIGQLVNLLKNKMDFYRGQEYDFPDTEELYREYAIANRFDNKDTIFFKRILQTVLPEELRCRISSEIFKETMGVTEKQLAYELYMTEDQVSLMKREGMHIGLHGYDHYWLGNLPSEQMKTDISSALDALNEYIDSDNWAIAYPYGSFNDEVISFIKNKGAKLAFTTEVNIADSETNPYLIPRLDCNDLPPKSNSYIRVLEGR